MDNNLYSNNPNHKSNNKGFKILFNLLFVVVAVIVFSLILYFGSPIIKNIINNQNKLSTVNNITYSRSEKDIKWDAVDHADTYYVKINEKESDALTETHMEYMPTHMTTEISVKASDSTGEYQDSDWSEPIVVKEQSEFSYAAVCEFLQKGHTFTLQNVLNIYISDDNEIRATIVTNDVNGVMVHNLKYTFNNNITSIEEAINGDRSNVKSSEDLKIYKCSQYEAAESLLKSQKLAGQMEKYQKDGWKISVVSSQTSKIDSKKSFYIFGNFKLEKDGQVLYVQSSFGLTVNKLSRIEYLNYTSDIEDPNNFGISEESFKVLSDEEVKFLGFTTDLSSTATEGMVQDL